MIFLRQHAADPYGRRLDPSGETYFFSFEMLRSIDPRSSVLAEYRAVPKHFQREYRYSDKIARLARRVIDKFRQRELSGVELSPEYSETGRAAGLKDGQVESFRPDQAANQRIGAVITVANEPDSHAPCVSSRSGISIEDRYRAAFQSVLKESVLDLAQNRF
jgi:hypothetical protein